MSQESNDKRGRFEQKMREQGADGFADGPRPWETWDESGNQANNRIWEGSAKRVNGIHQKNSFGQRLLSSLALIALTTLLVGIGGVYYTHTQTQIQQLAQTAIQPAPVIDQARPEITSPDNEVVVAAATETNKLNVLSAPAAGTESMRYQVAAAAETATADSEVTPATDEPANEPATAITATTSTGTIPPVTNGSIDSVAIETIITEQSVTTTVYTRHPRQDEPEIVAAIETTPPPFTYEIAAEQQPTTDSLPSTVAATDTGTLDDQVMALSTLPPPAAQASIPALAETDAVDDNDAISLHEDQHTQDSQLDEPAGEAMMIALADMSNATSSTEPVAETAADTTEEQLIETMEPVIPVAKTGNWVINLSSYTWKSTANKKLALFQQQGVDAEVFEVMIKDKPMYRIRVTGFENSRTAKAEIPTLEQKLDLEGAWISKR